MEILQTIWEAITTPNEMVTAILYFPIFFVDAIVNMLLFTTILNINASKKSKVIYIIAICFVAFISRTFIQDPYATFLNLLFGVLLIKFVLKANFLKSLIAVFIPIVVSTIIELLMLRIYLILWKIPFDYVMTVPLYRIVFILSIYTCIYLIYKLIKYFKLNINLEDMTKKSKILFIITTIVGIATIATQLYLISFYSDTTPTFITIISIFTLFAYFIINIYSLLSTSKLETTSRDLEEAQLYNKTLTILHDTMRGFKHDFHNIVQGIGGYIDKGDLSGLQKYYKELLQDCNRVNNLTALSPAVVNNPAIYNILATKYHKADEIGAEILLDIFMDLNEIEKYMKIYEFTRILGILLDNAIEATAECEEKAIHVIFRKESNRNRLLMVIENTYKNKDINLDKIFEKDFSTKSKKTNSGLGLWEVRQLLKKNNNLNLFTKKNEDFFVQQFEIYY